MADGIYATLITQLKVEQTKFQADMKQAEQFASGTADRISSDISSKLVHGFSVAGIAGKTLFSTLAASAETAISGINAAVEGLKASLALLALPTSIVVGVGLISRGIDDISDAADKLGTSVNSIQKFAYETATVGVSIKDTEKFFEASSKRIAEFSAGVGRTSKLFQTFGIDVKQFAGLDPAAGLQKLFEVTKNLDNNSKIKLFDAYAEGLSKVIPLVSDGTGKLEAFGKEFDQLGLALSKNQIQNAGGFADNIDKLLFIYDAFKQQIAGELAAPLAKITTDLIDAIKNAGGIQEAAKNVASFILEGFKSFIGVIIILVDAVRNLGALIQKSAAFVKAPLTSTGEAIGDKLYTSVHGDTNTSFGPGSPAATSGLQKTIDYLSGLQNSINKENNPADAIADLAKEAINAKGSLGSFTQTLPVLIKDARSVLGDALKTAGASIIKSAEAIEKSVTNTVGKAGDKIAKQYEDNQKTAQGLLGDGNTLGSFVNKDVSAQDPEFNRNITAAVKEFTKNGNNSAVKSYLQSAKNVADYAGGSEEVYNPETNEYDEKITTNAQMLSAFKQAQQLTGNAEKDKPIKIEIAVDPSPLFTTTVSKTAKDAAYEVAQDEARKVTQ